MLKEDYSRKIRTATTVKELNKILNDLEMDGDITKSEYDELVKETEKKKKDLEVGFEL